MDQKKVVGIIQARMTSSRLRGKMTMPVAGRPLLERLLDRLALCRTLDEICLATTTNADDDPLVAICAARGIAVHRGSEHDVLGRFHDAALGRQADVCVRITGDCPLLDPAIVDAHVRLYLEAGSTLDYVWCGDPPTLPNGMTCEVFSISALTQARGNATADYDREHVTPYLRRPGNGFRMAAFRPSPDLSMLRLSVDTPEDLRLVDRIWSTLGREGPGFSLADIAQILDMHPDWRAINAHIVQQTGPHRPGGERL